MASERLDPRVEERWQDGTLHLVLRPQRWAALPLVFFTLVWNVFLFGWFRVALHAPGPLAIALWFPLLHVVVGGVVAYEAALALFGRVELRLGRGLFSARRRPLPSPGRVEMSTSSLDGFDVAARAPSPLAFRAEVEGGPRFVLLARRRDGTRHQLPVSFPDEERAAAMANRLEEALTALRMPRGYRS